MNFCLLILSASFPAKEEKSKNGNTYTIPTVDMISADPLSPWMEINKNIVKNLKRLSTRAEVNWEIL
jgi:hypothetical protein